LAYFSYFGSYFCLKNVAKWKAFGGNYENAAALMTNYYLLEV